MEDLYKVGCILAAFEKCLMENLHQVRFEPLTFGKILHGRPAQRGVCTVVLCLAATGNHGGRAASVTSIRGRKNNTKEYATRCDSCDAYGQPQLPWASVHI